MPSLCCAKFCKQIVRARVNTRRFRSGDVEIFAVAGKSLLAIVMRKLIPRRAVKCKEILLRIALGS